MAALLDGERVFLDLADFRPGDLVTWLHVPRGGWGFTSSVSGVVVRVGRARVTIEVPLRGGGSRTVRVAPTSLRRRAAGQGEG